MLDIAYSTRLADFKPQAYSTKPKGGIGRYVSTSKIKVFGYWLNIGLISTCVCNTWKEDNFKNFLCFSSQEKPF